MGIVCVCQGRHECEGVQVFVADSGVEVGSVCLCGDEWGVREMNVPVGYERCRARVRV